MGPGAGGANMLPAEAAGNAVGEAAFGTALATACRDAAGTVMGAAATVEGDACTAAGAGTGAAAHTGAWPGIGVASRVVTSLFSSAAGTLSVLQGTCCRVGLHAM